MTTLEYKELNLHEHVLKRPDTYVGSIQPETHTEYIIRENRMVSKEIQYIPAILRVYIEALSNAIDNKWRSDEMNIPFKSIKINIDQETGETSVWNDGYAIPIEKNEKGIYIPEMLFGHLLTSSNYNDEEERYTSGKNGLGITLCNIFSTDFQVTVVNDGVKYTQLWRNNMREATPPKLKKASTKTNYVEVKWVPDFSYFGVDGYSDDMMGMMYRYAYDAAMITGVSVYLNDERMKLKTLKDYAKLFSPEEDSNEFLHIEYKKSEMVLMPADKSIGYESVSFVNGIYTRDGGVHVDSWLDSIFKPLVEKVNKKYKNIKLTMKDLKQYFRIFVKAWVPNPQFASQTKDRMTAPKLVTKIETKNISSLMKWGWVQEVEDLVRARELVSLKKTERKVRGYTRIEGVDAANKAGTKDSHKCVLVLCEGDSAKTFAVKGLEQGIDWGNGVYKGRDYIGIFALRGKCFAKDTKILMWDGTIKCVQDIKIGDKIIGDDGTPRIVDRLYSGEDKMYKIKQNKAEDYVVSAGHMLTLKASGHKTVVWNEIYNRWQVYYFNKQTMSMSFKSVNVYELNYEIPEQIQNSLQTIEEHYTNPQIGNSIRKIGKKYSQDYSFLQKHYQKCCKEQRKCYCGLGGRQRYIRTKNEAYEEILKLQDEIPDEDGIIDITIEDYLELSENTKNILKGYKSNGVYWPKQKITIDPYILGMWLGDGESSGYGFSSEDRILVKYWINWARNNNIEISHRRKDAFTIRRANGKGYKTALGTLNSTDKNCPGCKEKPFPLCSEKTEYPQCQTFKGSGITNPFVDMLKEYDLIRNKHIPKEYLFNDRDTRLKILAGIIDTDGYVSDDGRIEISQGENHLKLVNDIVFLARSLGFSVRLSNKKTTWTYQGIKKFGNAYRIYISGFDMETIPTILPRKICLNSIKKSGLNTGIKIEKMGEQQYYGFSVTGGNSFRFLLEDFTVVHNCLNTRNANTTAIANNKEITKLIQALGVQYDVDYSIDENFNKLRYGKVLGLTDSDDDGLHILGLILNVFDSLFPSLMRRKGFLCTMQTPVMKIKYKGEEMRFYNSHNAHKFLEENRVNKDNVKYYKGLGTSSDKDIKETFGKKMVIFNMDEQGKESLNKVFHNDFSDERKKWLETYDPKKEQMYIGTDHANIQDISITDFIDTEFIKFSIDDCKRSIPSMVDGLKESQRKVLYACFLKNLPGDKTIKVAQLAGFVAEKTSYHHGEQNLYDTITKMAQDFVGSNNIPLLYRDGQFGSRLNNGKDAANARYIFTRLEKHTKQIFPSDDMPLLNYLHDEGEKIEPEYYVPLLPMILVNGGSGIGTGWSCYVPSYNPSDIISWILDWLDRGSSEIQLHPWYRGFTGQINKLSQYKYTTHGIVHGESKKVTITEIPVGMSIDKCKENLEELCEKRKIKNFKNHSNANKVKFEFTPLVKLKDKDLPLTSSISVTNLVLFNSNGQLHKYKDVYEILEEFCRVRLEFYLHRKNYMLDKLHRDKVFMTNKLRFMKKVMKRDLVVFQRPEEDIVRDMEEMKFEKVDDKYDYLLNLSIRSFTTSRLEDLTKKITEVKEKIEKLKSTDIKNMWRQELNELKIQN